MLNLKNHTTPRFWQLSATSGADQPAFAASTTYRFNLSNVPYTTRRMCNYLVGIMVTVLGATFTYRGGVDEGIPGYIDQSDILRALFESAEVQQTMLGTPVSANHYLGKYFGLFEYLANGLQVGTASMPPLGGTSTASRKTPINFFVPLCSLLGAKGHHTALPVVCYDRAQFILRTTALTGITGLTANVSSASLKVSAIVIPEPELRLGPGTSFMQYTQVAAATGSIVTIDALGNATTLEGAEPGAGIAAMLWMGANERAYGGAQNVRTLEYLAAPFRDLQQTRHLEPFISDWMNACGMGEVPFIDSANELATGNLPGGGHRAGYLYSVNYPISGGANPNAFPDLLDGAEFLPIIVPRKFLETSKLQVVQGSQTIGIKSTGSFSGQHVFTVLQYHSWTPAKKEEVLRALVDKGVAQTVWGTNNLKPSIKVINKQQAESLNPSKTRFFADTWIPNEAVNNAPTT